METKKGLAEPLNFIEENGKKGKDLLAFWDFCLDFFGRGDCICLPHVGSMEHPVRREGKFE